MNSSSQELKKVFAAFPESCINSHNELILYPQTNLYFLLDDIVDETQLNCKILEWCSRAAFKTEPYRTAKMNKEYNALILARINKILGTSFRKTKGKGENEYQFDNT